MLSEEQEMIRATAREFAQERLAPRAAEWDREARFPAEAVREMADLGFLGMTVPAAYDGAETDPIRRVDAGGGIPRPAVAVDIEAGETAAGWPEFLPDGRRFLYVLWAENANPRLMLGELDSDEATYLMDVDSRVQYAEPGHLVYVRDDTLVVQRFDAKSGEITGDPRPLAQQMGIN